MKHILSAVTVFAAVLAGSNPAWAVSIGNLDDQEYDVTVIDAADGASTTFTLGSGQVEEDVCDACRIMIEGVGAVDAQGNEIIEISGGKFLKRNG